MSTELNSQILNDLLQFGPIQPNGIATRQEVNSDDNQEEGEEPYRLSNQEIKALKLKTFNIIRKSTRKLVKIPKLAHKAINKLNADEEESHNYCCSICLNEFKNKQMLRELNCKHLFHRRCVDKWLRRSLVCPMCRASQLVETNK